MKLLITLMTLLIVSFANAETYKMIEKEKGIEFLVSKNKKRDDGTFGKTDVLGQMDKFNGQFDYTTDGNISNLIINTNMSSVKTGIDKRDKHLRSEDFFNVDKFKFSTFTTKKDQKFKVQKDGKVTVKGKLKIKSTEKEISLVLFVKPTRGSIIKITSPKEFSTTIDRREFNVKHNIKVSAGMLGGLIGKFKNYVGQNVIGNTVSIRLNVHAKMNEK